MQKKYYVYIATNTINNKVYVGFTSTNLIIRQRQHKSFALRKKSSTKFANAIKKYGWEVFSWEVVFETTDSKEALLREKGLIEIHNSTILGYNIDFGGIRSVMNTDTKRKISEKVKKLHAEGKYKDISGRNNPAGYDETIYVFFNLKTKERFEGTRTDFRVKYGFSRSPINLLVNKKKNMYYYWILETVEVPVRFKFNLDNFKFKNIKTGDLFEGTRFEFCQKYNIKLDVIRHLVNGKSRVSSGGWTLVID